MYFLPISLALFLLFLILIPVLFVLAPGVAFAKLGLPPALGFIFFISCLIGGGINLPVHRERVVEPVPEDALALFHRLLGVRLPAAVRERIIAVNVGGAVLPGMLCLYLLGIAPWAYMLPATAIVSAVAYALSRPVPGVGIVMPTFVPPIVAAITALLLAREQAPQVAYFSGVMGTLIGADILRLPQIKRLNAPILSIGGAGVFDGIYLVGLVSVLLA
jgi:uncharacterized membrane protein